MMNSTSFLFGGFVRVVDSPAGFQSTAVANIQRQKSKQIVFLLWARFMVVVVKGSNIEERLEIKCIVKVTVQKLDTPVFDC